MKVVRLIDRSSRNELVGTTWQEVEIFDTSQPISDLFKANKNREFANHITLTMAECDHEEFMKSEAENSQK